MWGAGQAAGRQSRVAASPSSSTWSLSLMWKTGGKSGGRADSHGSERTPAHLLMRKGRICVRAGEQSERLYLPNQMQKVEPHADVLWGEHHSPQTFTV